MEIGEPVAKIKGSENISVRPPTTLHQFSYLWGQAVKLLLCLGLASLMGCSSTPSSPNHITRKSFGKTKDGTEVYLFTLRNEKGAEARISNYGGLVVSLKVPDRNGKL